MYQVTCPYCGAVTTWEPSWEGRSVKEGCDQWVSGEKCDCKIRVFEQKRRKAEDQRVRYDIAAREAEERIQEKGLVRVTDLKPSMRDIPVRDAVPMSGQANLYQVMVTMTDLNYWVFLGPKGEIWVSKSDILMCEKSLRKVGELEPWITGEV